MLPYIIPAMDAASDSDAIQSAIRQAVESGCNRVLIPKKKTSQGFTQWEIDRAILLPSNITILLDDCHLRLKDGVYENMFRNENMYQTDTYTLEQEQHNIYILGRGRAVLDGGKANGLTEATSNKNGLPHIRNNNLILLHNVRDYVLEGFQMINQRHWAVNQLFCRNGRLSHLSFFNGETRPNQDGINLRIGCNNILVEDITGRTGDDTVALSAFPKGSDGQFAVRGKDGDIHDVIIRDVRASTRQTIVALRNNDGAQLYRVVIENVFDMPSDYVPWGVVKVGENNYYRERSSILGETREITIRNVRSRGAGCVFLGASLQNSHISDVYASGGTMHAISTYLPEMVFPENNCVICGGVSMENVCIENVYYQGTAAYCDDPGDGSYQNRYTDPGLPFKGCALDFRRMRPTDRLDHVVFRHIFADTPDRRCLHHPDFPLEIQA